MAACVSILLFLLLLLFLLRDDVAARRLKRQTVQHRSDLWPNWTVPFEIQYYFSMSDAEAIRKAMREWEVFSCIKFVPFSSGFKKFAFIKQIERGCDSDVGAGAAHPTMQLDDSCMTHRVLLHELGHLLGLHHEHSRPDRDRHLQVRAYLASPGMKSVFDVKHDLRTFGLPYSAKSIMHYSKEDFSIPNEIAMEAHNPELTDQIGRLKHLDFKDVQLINLLYDCADCSTSKRCPPGAFLGPNCRCWCPDEDVTAVDCQTKLAIDPSRVRDERGKIIADRRYGHTYFGSDLPASWFDARRKCREMGGHLLDVNKMSIAKRLYKLVSIFLDKRFVRGKIAFWVGGNDLAEEGKFVWGDGKKVRLNAYNTQEVDNGRGRNEDCLCVTPNPHREFLQFRDWDCGLELRFICELPHKGCYDLSPTCGYYQRAGECSYFKKLCPKSCGLCGAKKKNQHRSNQTLSFGNPKERPVASDLKERPEASNKTHFSSRCHQLTCYSALSTHMLLGTRIGSDICVDCPPCSCLRPNYGFRIYPSFARVCCAVAQMTNSLEGGLSVITRRAGQKKFPEGVKNDIVSIRTGPAPYAFTVKGQELRKVSPTACVMFKCDTAPRQSTIFNRIGFGQRMCVHCPVCLCSSSSVVGFRVYQKKSSACCAIQQMVGMNGGRFFIKKVWGRSIYGSGSQFNLRSRRGFARDDYAFQIVI